MACKLSGANCAQGEEATTGQPIFDTFRYQCLNWADEVIVFAVQHLAADRDMRTFVGLQCPFDVQREPACCALQGEREG